MKKSLLLLVLCLAPCKILPILDPKPATPIARVASGAAQPAPKIRKIEQLSDHKRRLKSQRESLIEQKILAKRAAIRERLRREEKIRQAIRKQKSKAVFELREARPRTPIYIDANSPF